MSADKSLKTNLGTLIDEEQKRTAVARDRFGTFVPLCEGSIVLLNSFIKSIGRDHYFAAALMLSIQKSATLSFLSYIRGHIAQAEFNSRQVIEFCALTAYLLAHPEEDVIKEPKNDSGGFKSPKAISGKAYKWLEKEHPHHSALLKDLKNQINDATSHASVYLTRLTFDWESSNYDKDQFRGSFFDNVDEDVIRLYLMSFARLIVIVVEVLRLVSEKHGGFTLKEGAQQELSQLDKNVNAHRDILSKRLAYT